MTAADSTRSTADSYFDILTARFNAGVVTSPPAKPYRFPPSVARLPAFTVDLDLKRLDVGLAEAMEQSGGMGG